MYVYGVILPDSWWDNGRLKSAERNSGQQRRHSSEDETVVVHLGCYNVGLMSTLRVKKTPFMSSA